MSAPPESGAAGSERVVFAASGEFLRATRRDVAELLADPATSSRGRRRLYAKAAAFVALMLASWLVLMFARAGVAPLVALVGLAAGAYLTALGVQHDANHGAFFVRRRANRLVGWTSDALLGFSSYAWRVRHNVAHHTYTNIDRHDSDITQEPAVRLAPSQRRRPWHRLQVFYVWPLYALMALRLQTYGDLVVLFRGRIGRSSLKAPGGWDLVGLVAGKGVFATWAIVIPMLVYPPWLVAAAYVGIVMALSLGMVVVFQLAHCVEDAAFPTAASLHGQGREWAAHELETTVDFCPRNRLATFALGGLNYQIEHHLFPRVPHTLYPAIAPIVERNATRYGLRYAVQPTFARALRSHVRHLRSLSRDRRPAEIELG
jgi:linoleoyl-CoA desaturase